MSYILCLNSMLLICIYYVLVIVMIFWDENGQMIHMGIYSSSTFYFRAKIILCLAWSLQLLLVLLYYGICSWSYPLWCCKWVTHLLDPAWGMPQLGCIRWVTQLHPPPQDWPIRAKHRPQLGSKGVSHQIHPVAGVEAKCPQIKCVKGNSVTSNSVTSDSVAS